MSDDAARSRVAEVVARFPSCRVLVVGDIMLDEYIFGTVRRISPEAPVPVVAVTRETKVPGGAANVALNLCGLRVGVEMAGLLGDDAAGRFVARMLKGKRVGVAAAVADPDRPTTVKTRVIAHSQQVVRVDRERMAPPYQHTCDTLLRKALAALGGRDLSTDLDVWEAGKDLLRVTRSKAVLITRGEEGMTLVERGRDACFHVPAFARQVFDVTGAGDTVIGTLAACLAAGSSMREAAVLANVAASVVVGEVGTAPITTEKLLRAVEMRERPDTSYAPPGYPRCRKKSGHGREG